MGSKTRSMGLSSLVVTTLDKGAASELLASGWTPVIDPPRLLPLAYHGKDTAAAPQCVLTAVGISTNPAMRRPFDPSKALIPKQPPKTCSVMKASTTWRKSWNKRTLSFDGYVLSLQKTDSSKMAYKTLAVGDIERVDLVKSSGSSQGESECLLITFLGEKNSRKETDNWKLRFNSPREASDWRMMLATGALVDEIAHGTPQNKNTLRLQHLISECGANLEFQVTDKMPLILFAVMCKRNDIVAALLKKNVDARSLLRLSNKVRANLPVRILLQLLEATGRDLNLVGDDVVVSLDEDLTTEEDHDGNWTLLHHLVVQRDVEATERLLQRIDRPTINLRTRMGETALTLALRKLHSTDIEPAGQSTIISLVRILLAHGADPNAKASTGDSAFLLACKRSAELPLTIFQLLEDVPNLNVNIIDRFGDAPIHILLKLNQGHLAKRLANDSRVDLNIRDSSGISTLVLTMMLNEESFASYLLTKGADGSLPCVAPPTLTPASSAQRRFSTYPNCTTDTGGDETNLIAGNRPIHVAIRLHMTSLALKLVDRLPVEALTVRDSEGRTPLLNAILHSLLGVAHAIVQKLHQGGKREALDEHDQRTGDTALQLSIKAGRVELANALLDAGADISERNLIGETSIHVCARFVERTYNSTGGYTALKLFNRIIDMDAMRGAASCVNMPTLLVEKISEHMKVAGQRLAKTSRGEIGAQPVVHQAASCANEQCGLWLLDALFKSPVLSLEVFDGAGLTPLACAIEAHNAEICKLLLGKTNIRRSIAFGKDSYMHLVLKHLGSQTTNAESLLPLVDMLLAHGAFVGVWDNEGYTPLHIAAGHKKYLSALQTLLRDGDVLSHRLDDRTEFSGLTPLMIAIRQSKSPEIVEALLEAGSDVRLLEPRTRKGVFKMCLEDDFDAHPDNLAICVKLVRRVPEALLLCQGDEEWKARRVIAEKHAALIAAAEDLDNSKDVEEKVTERRLSNPLLMCNDRIASETTKMLLFAANAGSSPSSSKRALSARGTENISTNGTIGSLEPETKRSIKKELDQKVDSESQSITEPTSDDDPEEHRSSDESLNGTNNPDVRYGSRLSQLDRALAVEQIRAEAVETANAWLETESGKKMIAQVANVLISETDESITQEAAIALARRNFIEEQVKAGLEQFRAPTRVLATHESSYVGTEDGSFVNRDESAS